MNVSAKVRLLAILVVATVLLGLAWPVRAQDAQPDDRGAYLAAIAGCNYCHSPDEDTALSGNWITWNEQKVYAPNLTPSSGGLGDWTRNQIAAAITTGIRTDGHQLHPAMPYLYYNGMADTDLDALLDYLVALDPVEASSQPPPELPADALPPIPVRASGIQMPDASDQISYGEYLVESVMACGVCHTPPLPDGQPDPALHLAGGMSFSGEWGTVYASNITGDMAEGLGPRSDDSIMVALTAGYHSANRLIYAMPWRSYQAIAGSDLEAVVAYLREVSPEYAGVPTAELNPEYNTYPYSDQSGSGKLATYVMLAVIGGVVIYIAVRQYQMNQRIRETDWQTYFTEVLEREGQDESSADSPDNDSE